MAGDWIKMRTDLLTSPKVIRMASALNADRFRIAGGLLSVWSLFDAHSVDGILQGYSSGTVDELAAWPGFAESMIAVGWLEQNGSSLEMPRFDSHNGASAKRRAQDADRKRQGRKTSASDEDKKETREEKRREENIEDKPPLSPKGEKPKRKTKIPEPFMLTSEMRAWASESAPAVDLKSQTENFVDYWRGAGGTKLDWVATWRTWMRKAQDDSQKGGRGGYKPFNKQEAIEAANQRVVDQVIAEERARRLGFTEQPEIDLGDAIVIDGEVIHAD